MSSHAASADPRAFAGRLTLPRVAAEPLATVAFGAVLAAIALQGGGGLQLGPLTKVELAIDAAAGGLAAAAIVVGGHTRRLWGAVTLALMAALVAVTALSITWAVEPSGAVDRGEPHPQLPGHDGRRASRSCGSSRSAGARCWAASCWPA